MRTMYRVTVAVAAIGIAALSPTGSAHAGNGSAVNAGLVDSASELLLAALSHRKRCTSLHHRRFITRHLHRFTSGHPCTSHPSTLDRGTMGVRIEVIDASDLQPLVGVSNENPASSRGRGSLYLGYVGCVIHWLYVSCGSWGRV